MFSPTSRGARRAAALPGARRAISSSSLFSPIREFFRYENWLRGSALQERADVLRLYLLLAARETWPDVKLESHDAVRAEAPTLDAQRERVSERALAQTLRLLEGWRRVQPPAPPFSPEEPPPPPTAEELAEAAALRAARQREAFGFELAVGESAAGEGAGRGVFLRGGVAPGSVLALYPGVAMTPYDLLTMPGGTARFKDNEYLMARFDGAVIDASADGLAKLPHEGADCPLAVGHLFNHPPADVAPSVVPCAVDFDADVPHDLVPLLPNVHYLPASEQQLLASNQQQLLLGEGATRTDGITQQSLLLGDGAKRTWSDAATELVQASLADMSDEPRVGDGEAVRLRGLAFVATRELQDEELFLNYRLNPANPRPDWYTPVDLEEDKRRWNT